MILNLETLKWIAPSLSYLYNYYYEINEGWPYFLEHY